MIALLLGLHQEFKKYIASSFLKGTAELGLFNTQGRAGLPENPWSQES